MDTALHQKLPFILDRNLAKANCTENYVCTSCDTVVLDSKFICITDTNGGVTRDLINNLCDKFFPDLVKVYLYPRYKWRSYKRFNK